MDWRSAALRVLKTSAPDEKCSAAIEAAAAFDLDRFSVGSGPLPPARPARPESPALCAPTAVPKRRFGTVEGRAATLHALAHIEFNAIDLAFDMAARFAAEIAASGLSPDEFVFDWFRIGAEEAGHFALAARRLGDLGSHYGAFPAHDGLWDAAIETADSVLARLAIAPMVLEARGLDVTPGMAQRFRKAGDEETARIIDRIQRDEIGHVAAGVRWFTRLCAARGTDPAETFRALVRKRFRGVLKPPFNHEARGLAGLPTCYYMVWNGPCGNEAAAEAGTC